MRHILVVTTLVTSLVLPLLAHAGPDDEVKYRRSVMKAVEGDLRLISGILKGSTDHPAALGDLGQALSLHARQAKDAFRVNTVGKSTEKTEVKGDLVWSKAADFNQRMDKFASDANLVAMATAKGDKAAIGAALKELGGNCKSCHQTYQQ